MAGNSLLTVADITDRATAILADSGDTIMLCRREDEAFTRKIGETYSMRVAERVAETTGRVADAQAITQTFVDITINQQQHQAFNLSVQERSLSMDRLSDLVIGPRASQIAAGIESDLHSLYTGVYRSAGTPGTTPNSLTLLFAPNTRLDESGAPSQERWMILNAAAKAGLATVIAPLPTPNQSIAADALTQGFIKQLYEYRRGVFYSNAVRVHTNGAWGDSTPLTNGTTADGATQVVTDGWASGTGTVATGDVFTMAGVYEVHPQTRISTGRLMQFVCNAGLTATGTAMTIPITPTIRASGVNQNVNATPANDAALTFMGTAGTQYPQNLVGRPDGIALAMVDQDIEEWISAGNGAKQDYMGIRLATTKGPDTRNNQVLWRMDCIYGRVLVDLAQIVRFWG